ncbi:hypothetical protein [Marinomonas sp. THO17]|uniref:hypothetical protein n=1 Tax=Marinomonas sp. THO17 TaxID=3149048 RepID=UPI00336BF132
MLSFKERVGEEIYHILYSYEDKHGNEFEDRDDLLLCEDEDIPLERVKKLKLLISYGSSDKEVIIAFEAAKLLCAWGEVEGIKYMKYFMEKYYGDLRSSYPMSHHRLYGYDTTVEEIEEVIMCYQARWSDRLAAQGNSICPEIRHIVTLILNRAKLCEHNMLGIIQEIKQEKWHYFDTQLKECMIAYLEKEDQSRNSYWNTIDLKVFFEERDPEFLSKIEEKYGVIDIPDSVRNQI